MRRRLLLTLAGLGTSAAAVFLMSGTAHALAPPPPTVRPPVPPVHLTVPKPPAVVTVKTVTTKVVHEVTQAAPVKKVAALPVVVKRVTGSLDHSSAVPTAVVHRSLAVAPKPLRIARSSRTSEVDASAFTSTDSTRPSARMRATPTRPASHGSPSAFPPAGLTDSAVSPVRSSMGSPFAAIATRAPFVGTATRWLTFPTADRTRPGFLVGSVRPG